MDRDGAYRWSQIANARFRPRHCPFCLFIQLHGDEATAKERETVEKMRRNGANDGAGTWSRIIVAIGELGEPDRGAALRRDAAT